MYLLFLGYRFTRRSAKVDRLSWVIFGTLLLALGSAFIIGIVTQIAAVISFVLALIAIYIKKKGDPSASESAAFYLLFGIVSLSLVFLGAGPYAFDLPL